jgi:diguanylate cyclase (GGDEF)-like protein
MLRCSSLGTVNVMLRGWRGEIAEAVVRLEETIDRYLLTAVWRRQSFHRRRKPVTAGADATVGETTPAAAVSLPVYRDHTRIQTIATYVYLLGYAIPLAVTSALALRRGEAVLGAILGIFAAVSALILWRVYRHGLGPGVRTFLVAAAGLLFLYLALSGGYAGTGLFWCFALIVVIYHFSRAIAGLIVNLSLVVLSAILLLRPEFAGLHPDYEAAVISRFLVTATITCFLLFFYAMMQQVLTDRLTEAQEQLYRVSMTDELTGLINRRSMNDAIKDADQRSPGERAVAIVVADVDHFKAINDTLGHDAGDQVLRHIATVMKNTLRGTDRVARWGGEEFLLMLDVVDSAEAADVAERVRAALEENPAQYRGTDVPVTASFGIRVVVDAGESLQQAIIRADANLLRAKEEGRNRVVAG